MNSARTEACHDSGFIHLGAILILAAYGLVQLRWLSAGLTFSLVNLGGSLILTIVAVAEEQIGFALLEGVWALISIAGLISALRGLSARSDSVGA